MAGFRELVGATLTIDGVAVSPPMRSFTPGNVARESLDSSGLHNTTYKTMKPGKLRKLEPWSVVLDWDPAYNYAALLNTTVAKTIRITLPLESGESTAGYFEFTGHVMSFEKSEAAVDSLITATLMIEPDGNNYSEQAPT
jgi:hypothetical protein